MRRHILTTAFALALLALALAGGTTPAAAQENGTATPAPTGELIDQNTVLLNATYNSETGESIVTLKSEILQDVVLTDASGLLQGGETAMRTVTLTPGDRTTVRIESTKADGYVVVGISTRETLYGKQIETSTSLFRGDATWDLVQAGALGGGFGVLALTGVLAWRRRRGGRQKVRRVS